jgi:hypothetical protein
MENKIDYLEATHRKLGKVFLWMLWSATIMQYTLILLDMLSMFPNITGYFSYFKEHRVHATGDTSTVYLITLGLYIGVKEWSRKLSGITGITSNGYSINLAPKEAGKRLEKGVVILILQFMFVLVASFLVGMEIIQRMPDELLRTFAQTGIGYITTLGLKQRLSKKNSETRGPEYREGQQHTISEQNIIVKNISAKDSNVIGLINNIEKLLMEKGSLNLKECEAILNVSHDRIRYAMSSLLQSGKVEALGSTKDRKYKLT